MESVDSTPASDFMVIAHRGASSYAPETTIAAFDLAIRMGVGHLDLVRAGGMVEGVTITSFQKARLEETRAYAPESPTGWLVGEASEAIVAEAQALGLTQLCPKADTVTPALVHRLHAEGFVVRA